MKPEQKYKIGETVEVQSWTDSHILKIVDVQWVYHLRADEHVWGYKMDGYTGLTMDYVPEGYLRKLKK